MKVSIISPVYFAEKIIPELINQITKEVNNISSDYEIILVDDGSQDGSWEKIEEIAQNNPNVIGIKLSRNFGQHYAVSAGLKISKGEVSIIVDCDLQDKPSEIQKLIDAYKEGNEVVFTKRISRKHSFFKSISAYFFNVIFNWVSNKDFDVNAGSMVLIGANAKKAFLKVNDHDRLYLQLLKWVGFKNTTVLVEHAERYSGKSTYNFFTLLKIALQGFTSFSNRLLYFSIFLGIIFSALSFISICIIVLLYFIQGFQSGWASLISSIFLCTGVILVNIGILGLYIGKTFNQTKNRPLYIIEKKLNYHE